MNRHQRRALSAELERMGGRVAVSEWADLTARLRLFLPEIAAYRDNDELRTLDRVKETRERLRASILLSADNIVRHMLAQLSPLLAGASSDQIRTLTASLMETARQQVEEEFIKKGPWHRAFTAIDGLIAFMVSCDNEDDAWDDLFDSIEAIH